MLNTKDIEILRQLAEKYMTYATSVQQDKTRKMWYSLNRLQMEKPMVLIDQICWDEIKDESLLCQVTDPYWRGVEGNLRCWIYKYEHLPVDMVLTPYIRLPRPTSGWYGGGSYGLNYEVEILGDKDVKAQRFTDILAEEEDLEKIHFGTVVWDQDQEKLIVETAHMLFDGVAPFRMCGVNMHLGIWDWIASARGVTNCYFDLIDRPEFIHTIMRKLTDCVANTIDQLNAFKGFDAAYGECHCSVTLSDDLPNDANEATSDQAWAFGLAQLFSSVSPEITEEFEMPYMQELFSKFGAIYYGCCDRLDDRLDVVDRMPNIRKISCSPWSDREHFAEVLPKKYIMSNKPNPALLAAGTFDEELIRADLRRTMEAAKRYNVPLEMILKDISTLQNDPTRLWRWAQIAAEETANFG